MSIRKVEQLLRCEDYSHPPAGVGYARAGRTEAEGKQGKMVGRKAFVLALNKHLYFIQAAKLNRICT
jgi:hypothetical protein